MSRHRGVLVGLAALACVLGGSGAHGDDALKLEILAARAAREDGLAQASVDYRVRTPATAWYSGSWLVAPSGDVHALGPLPPHPVADQDAPWPVEHRLHELRQNATDRFWARADLLKGITDIAVEPPAASLIERLAGHPLQDDLIVDRWLQFDETVTVERTNYEGMPAAYVRTTYGNEAWLLEDYDWAVAELREVYHGWVLKADGYDRAPLLDGAAPQRLRWYRDGALQIELEFRGWSAPTPAAVYDARFALESEVMHIADRRHFPAVHLDVTDGQAVLAYIEDGVAPEHRVEPDEPEPIVWVIDKAKAHERFSLNDMPWINFGSFTEGGEYFGYLVESDPRMDEFSPLQTGDVILAIDGEPWRPQGRREFLWMLGRLTWYAVWDRPFTMDVVRDGQALHIEYLWG